MNQWVGQGGVTKDLEFVDAGYGNIATTFTVAVDKVYYDKESRSSKVGVVWVSINAFGPLADRLQTEAVGKGSKLRLVGELDQSPPKEGESRGHTRVNLLDYSQLRYATSPSRRAPSPGSTEGSSTAHRGAQADPWRVDPNSGEPPF